MPPRRPKVTGPLTQDDQLRRQLRPAVTAVTLPGDTLRRANLEKLRGLPTPALRLLIDSLIRVLRRSRRAAWGPAQASLAELGAVALPALYCACRSGRATDVRVRLAEVLEKMAASLPKTDLMSLFYDLDILTLQCADPVVVHALVRAQVAVGEASRKLQPVESPSPALPLASHEDHRGPSGALRSQEVVSARPSLSGHGAETAQSSHPAAEVTLSHRNSNAVEAEDGSHGIV